MKKNKIKPLKQGDNSKPRKSCEEIAKPGKPSKFSDDLAREICRRIALGETLTEICNSPDMPRRDMIYAWRASNKEFSDAYALAREDQAHSWADKIKDLLKETDSTNWKSHQTQINALQWLCARLHPHQYSDKLQITADVSVTGEIAHKLQQMTNAELDEFIEKQRQVGKRTLYGPTVEGEIDDNGGESL